MNDEVKKPYCHQCNHRHFKDEDHHWVTIVREGLKKDNLPYIKEVPEDCPVCAERRKKNAARMKRYRDKRRAKS